LEVHVTQQLIFSDPKVMMGQPVIAGTRITVDLILEKLSAGETFEQLLEAHPRLTREGIQAALNFAREALRADVVYPIVESAQ
jgi:uncharacterized protein (DUF433 family)